MENQQRNHHVKRPLKLDVRKLPHQYRVRGPRNGVLEQQLKQQQLRRRMQQRMRQRQRKLRQRPRKPGDNNNDSRDNDSDNWNNDNDKYSNDNDRIKPRCKYSLSTIIRKYEV